jgi:Transcriptional regulator/sugar kinase
MVTLLLKKLMQIYENRLARAIATAVNCLDPDVLVLGGGISNISRIYKTVPQLVQQWTFGGEFSTPILPSKTWRFKWSSWCSLALVINCSGIFTTK